MGPDQQRIAAWALAVGLCLAVSNVAAAQEELANPLRTWPTAEQHSRNAPAYVVDGPPLALHVESERPVHLWIEANGPWLPLCTRSCEVRYPEGRYRLGHGDDVRDVVPVGGFFDLTEPGMDFYVERQTRGDERTAALVLGVGLVGPFLAGGAAFGAGVVGRNDEMAIAGALVAFLTLVLEGTVVLPLALWAQDLLQIRHSRR